MPGSDISRISYGGQPRSEMASQLAREIATREITQHINQGLIDPKDVNNVRLVWREIYKKEYYRRYAMLMASNQQIQYVHVPVDNPTARKFLGPHSICHFTKSNLLIKVVGQTVIVQSFKYPTDSDISLETKEALLDDWPGPLDKCDIRLLEHYGGSLLRYDLQRRIKYERNDGQRRVILNLLNLLLERSGKIDASAINKLLLEPERTEINGNEKPIEMMQKYLLLGLRSSAIKYAESRNLWGHALCLTFLDSQQPQSIDRCSNDHATDHYIRFIDSLESPDCDILKIVYKSLLNNILRCDPKSRHLIKRPNVYNDHYLFAILSANDCEMEYDQTNEIFKLITAIKTAAKPSNDGMPFTNNHLISLGLTRLDHGDLNDDDIQDRSILSSKDLQTCNPDTYAARTHIISNIDSLVLNEIWECCFNLVQFGTNKPEQYQYNVNLVPYKLVFAGRLLDMGKYNAFDAYLRSIKDALEQAQQQYDTLWDDFYNWESISRSVDYLSDLWKDLCHCPHLVQYQSKFEDLESPPVSEPVTFNLPPPASFDTSQPVSLSSFQQPDVDSPTRNYPSLFNQNESAFTVNNFSAPPMPRGPYAGYSGVPAFNQPPPLIEEGEEINTDFNPDSEPYEQQQPEEQHDYPDWHQQQQQQQQQKPPLPQQQPHPPPQQQQQQQQHHHQQPPHYAQPREQKPPPQPQQQQPQTYRQNDSFGQAGSLESVDHSNETSRRPSRDTTLNDNDSRQQQRLSDQQQSSFIASLAGGMRSLLPKSNSKPMILPNDSEPSIIYDEKRGAWIDTSKTDGEDALDVSGPPPVQATSPPSGGYSFPARSAKTRYPKSPPV